MSTFTTVARCLSVISRAPGKYMNFIKEISNQRDAYVKKHGIAERYNNTTIEEVLARGVLHENQERNLAARASKYIGNKMNTATNCFGTGTLLIDAIRAGNMDFASVFEAPYWFTDVSGRNYMLAKDGIFWVDYYRIYSDGQRESTTKFEWDTKSQQMQDRFGYYDFFGNWVPGTERKQPPHKPLDYSKPRGIADVEPQA